MLWIVNYFGKILHLRCMTGFWTPIDWLSFSKKSHLSVSHFKSASILSGEKKLFVVSDMSDFWYVTQQTFVLMKTSSRRLDQDEYIHLTHRSSEDVFKTSWSRPIYSSWSYVFKTSLRRLAKTSSRHLEDVFKTFSRRLQDIFKTSC